MIRTYHRPVNEEDLKAITEGKGSLALNIIPVTLPIGLLLFVGVRLLINSYLVAAVVAALVGVASIISNMRFFRSVRQHERSGTEQSTVEVMEVEATRVLDVEHLGDTGPAYCFFTDDGKAVLLIGQWLIGVRKFPALSFRLLRWVNNGRPIRIEATGEQIEPEHSTVRLESHYSNSDIEVFPA